MASTALRVLVVEDEGLVAALIVDMREDLGNEVVAVAGRVSDALTKVADICFDVALLDVNVAGEPVYPVADAVSVAGIPFIFSKDYGTCELQEGYGAAPRLHNRTIFTSCAAPWGSRSQADVEELQRARRRPRRPAAGGAAAAAADDALTIVARGDGGSASRLTVRLADAHELRGRGAQGLASQRVEDNHAKGETC